MASVAHPDQTLSHGETVRRPSPGDAIGHALRRTFGRETDLPAVMLDCLARLDDPIRH